MKGGNNVMRTRGNMRWWIAGLLALAAALSYLDRQSFPVVVNEVRKFIPIDESQFARLTSLFLLAYALMYAGGGRLTDWLGTRAGYALMIVWWSLANLMLGTVSSVLGLGVFCFLLGVGEGGGFPASAKAVAEWFPPKERAMAFGIFNTGSSVGAVAAAPLIAVIVSLLGWRAVFFLTGIAGVIWAWIWFSVYSLPGTSRLISPKERDLIERSLAAERTSVGGHPETRTPWLRYFTYRPVQGLLVARFVSDAAWFCLIFRLPKYLGDIRHLNIQHIGAFAWIPYAFAGAGSLSGGWLSSFLIGRGMDLNRSRKIALGLGAALLPISLFITAAPLGWAIFFFGLAMFAHQFWSANVQTLPADMFPGNSVGSVGGLMGSAGALGGMVLALLIGWLIPRYGYGPVFLIVGTMHPLAFLVILATVPQIAPLSTLPNPPPQHTPKERV